MAAATDPKLSASLKLPTSVEVLSRSGGAPPPQYLVKESFELPAGPSSPAARIPVIDVSTLHSSPEEREKLRSALTSAGCFQAIRHGIPSSFLDKVREVAKQFFELPQEEKEKYSRAVHGKEGYGENTVVWDKQVLDWCCRISLTVFPEDQRRLHLWPKNPADFQVILHKYAKNVKALMAELYKAVAKSLDLEEDSFMKQFGERRVMTTRFNFYPRCSRPDQVFGVKPHTDKSGITVLLQDKEVEGLQAVKDDQWVTVPSIPDALVVNLGDQMQIMSNGIFKSALHRVLTNAEKLRISVAIIDEPEPERETGPLDSLIDETQPRLYKNVKDYGDIYYECLQKGKGHLRP